MKLAACLGKFNNFTSAHAGLVCRAASLADKVVVVISNGKHNADFDLRKAIAIEVLDFLCPAALDKVEFVHGDFKTLQKLRPDYFVCGEDRYESFEKSFSGYWTNVIAIARPEGAISSTLVRAILEASEVPWFYNEKATELAHLTKAQYEERKLSSKLR